MEKFAVNQATVAGLVTKAVFNDEKNRCNVTVNVNDGTKPQFLNVLISGEERYNNFKNSYLSALDNLGKKEEKQIQPLLKITGEALFSTNEINGVKNKNFSLIASGKLDKNNESFVLTSNQQEQVDFRKTYNSKNEEINNINLRGTISSEPKVQIVKNQDGQERSFTTFSIAHNYLQDDKPKTMYADIVVPTGLASEFNKAGYEKGSPILLNSKIQNSSYTKDDNKVYTFSLIAKSVQHDLNNATTVNKAVESIEKVADVSKAKERQEVKVEEINKLKGKEQTI